MSSSVVLRALIATTDITEDSEIRSRFEENDEIMGGLFSLKKLSSALMVSVSTVSMPDAPAVVEPAETTLISPRTTKEHIEGDHNILHLENYQWRMPDGLLNDREEYSNQTGVKRDLLDWEAHNDCLDFFTHRQSSIDLSVKGISLLKCTGVRHKRSQNSTYKLQLATFISPKKEALNFTTVMFHHAKNIGLSLWIECWDINSEPLPRWVESIWPRVAVFDMDSTLIQEETIDSLAKATDKQRDVQEITTAAMEGRLPFRESLSRRMACFKGLHWPTVLRSFVPTPTKGAHQLVKELKRAGVVSTALVSGGFLPWAIPLAESLGLDFAVANQFGVDNDKMTGKLKVGSIVVDDLQKATVLDNLVALHNNPNENKDSVDDSTVGNVYSLAVGDGGNDKLMVEKAYPFGVAFNAKQVLRDACFFHVNEYDLALIPVMIEASFPPKFCAKHNQRLEMQISPVSSERDITPSI
eukprot:GHVH01011004.1.p1 GENE.GHVH01011004.1~~GHVH01011004.1.p1  ORF type:complete len:469 (-),score=52.94 GHVH01011004.1:37-1443(-)